MNPHEINKLLAELTELSVLDDPAFTARTQSQRVCREAAHTIRRLLVDIEDLRRRAR